VQVLSFEKINPILESCSEISVVINSAIQDVYPQNFNKMQCRKKTMFTSTPCPAVESCCVGQSHERRDDPCPVEPGSTLPGWVRRKMFLAYHAGQLGNSHEQNVFSQTHQGDWKAANALRVAGLRTDTGLSRDDLASCCRIFTSGFFCKNASMAGLSVAV